jgi:hypothetical protein
MLKKRLIVLLLVSILLLSPLVKAETQSQSYSGFDRLLDNVKLFFSQGDNKVNLALEIREKEVNTAIVNIKNNNEDKANKNLENAMEKLVVVQEKVSPNIANKVEESVNNVVGIIEDSNLSDSLNRYVLEEKKTQLVAELVIEVNGTEGQTLTREIVQNGNENRKTVRVTIRNENGEIEEIEVEGEIRNDNAVWEIVGEINNVETDISEWVVKHTYAEGTGPGEQGNVVIEGGENEVVKSITKDNEDVKPAPNIIDNEINPGPQGIVGHEDTNEVVEGDGGEGDYAEGTSADPGSGGESSSEDSAGITGEVISENQDTGILAKIINFFKR